MQIHIFLIVPNMSFMAILKIEYNQVSFVKIDFHSSCNLKQCASHPFPFMNNSPGQLFYRMAYIYSGLNCLFSLCVIWLIPLPFISSKLESRSGSWLDLEQICLAEILGRWVGHITRFLQDSPVTGCHSIIDNALFCLLTHFLVWMIN